MPQYELNIRDYIRIFQRRKYIILLIVIVTTIGSQFMTPKLVFIFEASTTIKVEERRTVVGLLTEQLSVNPADRMESETKMITSYGIMRDVALRLGRINKNSSIEDVNGAITALQGAIATERVGNTNMIRITATTGNAKDAMDLANTTADVYINSNLLDKNKQARQTRQFITEQLSSLGVRLRGAEEKLKWLDEETKGLAASATLDSASPLQQKLTDMQFKLAEALQNYTEKHPQVIQLRDQIRLLEDELEAQIKQRYPALDASAGKAVVPETAQRGNTRFSKELARIRLRREVEVSRRLYGMLKERLEEARITEAQVVSDISVVNPAVMPGGPISGGGGRNMMMIGSLMGLVLGLAVAFVLETMDTTIGTIEDVERVVKLPVLGVVPSVEHEFRRQKGVMKLLRERFMKIEKSDEEERFTRLVAHFKPQSTISEAYKHIYANLKVGPSRKTILVTSSGPREGKSSVACNLGIVMAQIGLKTLVVGADVRRPVMAKTFGIEREPGINEVVKGAVTTEAALHTVTDLLLGDMKFEDIKASPGIENISIMPAGHPTDNPMKVLESAEFGKMVVALKNKFDAAIFDSPPVLLVADASILAPLMDCVIIVHEIGKTSREALIRSKVQLESIGAKVAGIVLNHIQRQSQSISIYPYYTQYRQAYTSKEDNDSKKGK